MEEKSSADPGAKKEVEIIDLTWSPEKRPTPVKAKRFRKHKAKKESKVCPVCGADLFVGISGKQATLGARFVKCDQCKHFRWLKAEDAKTKEVAVECA